MITNQRTTFGCKISMVGLVCAPTLGRSETQTFEKAAELSMVPYELITYTRMKSGTDAPLKTSKHSETQWLRHDA